MERVTVNEVIARIEKNHKRKVSKQERKCAKILLDSWYSNPRHIFATMKMVYYCYMKAKVELPQGVPP